MIGKLHKLDGSVEHREFIGQHVPALLVRPNGVIFAARSQSNPNMDELPAGVSALWSLVFAGGTKTP